MSFGVLYDVDGVLVDSYRPHFESWLLMAKGDGQNFTEQQFQSSFGHTSREIIARLWDSPRSEQEIHRLDDIKEEEYRKLVRNNFPAMPGAVELIRNLHGHGVLQGIGSSGPRLNVELAIEKMELNPYMKAVFTGNDIVHGKPNPEVFLKGAAAMGLPPSRCIVIEDSRAGLAAAKTAGMKCIVLLSYSHYREEYDQPDFIAESFYDLNYELIRPLIG